MKPAVFEYHRADTAADAVALLAELGDDAKLLGGGQSLIPMLALRLASFEHLVDISAVRDLRGIQRVDGSPERRGAEGSPERRGAEGSPERRGAEGSVRIGAGTTEASVERSPTVARDVPLLARATPLIGHFQIRNRGTIGGSLAHADPAAEYPAVALALDATFDALGPAGTRSIPAADFFTGLWETALAPGELLAAISFPVWTGRCGFAVQELARRHGDFAMAGAVVAVELDGDDRVARCGIGLIGMGSTPIRASAAEAVATGAAAGELDATEVGRAAVAGLDNVPADLHGSAAYRTRVGATMVARAWTDAIKEALGG